MVVEFKYDNKIFRLQKLSKQIDQDIGITTYICRLTPKPLISNDAVKKYIESDAFRVEIELENLVILESISYIDEYHDYKDSRDMINKQPDSITVAFNFIKNLKNTAIMYGCKNRLMPEMKTLKLNNIEYSCLSSIYISEPNSINTATWSVLLDLQVWGTSSPTTPEEFDEIINNYRYKILFHFTGLTVYNLMDNFNFKYHVEIVEDELKYYKLLIYIDSIRYANITNVELAYHGIAFQLVDEKLGIDINDVGDFLKIMLNNNNFMIDIKGILNTYTTKALYNEKLMYTCIFDVDGFCLNRYASINTQYNLNTFYYCTQYENDVDSGVVYAISPNDGVAIAITSNVKDFGNYIDTHKTNVVEKYIKDYDELISDEEKKIAGLSFFKKKKEKKALQHRMEEFESTKQSIINSIYTSKDVKFLWKIGNKCYYLLKK